VKIAASEDDIVLLVKMVSLASGRRRIREGGEEPLFGPAGLEVPRAFTVRVLGITLLLSFLPTESRICYHWRISAVPSLRL